MTQRQALVVLAAHRLAGLETLRDSIGERLDVRRVRLQPRSPLTLLGEVRCRGEEDALLRVQALWVAFLIVQRLDRGQARSFGVVVGRRVDLGSVFDGTLSGDVVRLIEDRHLHLATGFVLSLCDLLQRAVGDEHDLGLAALLLHEGFKSSVSLLGSRLRAEVSGLVMNSHEVGIEYAVLLEVLPGLIREIDSGRDEHVDGVLLLLVRQLLVALPDDLLSHDRLAHAAHRASLTPIDLLLILVPGRTFSRREVSVKLIEHRRDSLLLVVV